MHTAKEISEYILYSADKTFGDNICNMKLQKLLYYTQGFHLAFFGTKFFEDDIIAWQYGPVVHDIYSHYRHNENRSIAPPTELSVNIDTQRTNLINEVYKTYGQYSAWKLSEMTHKESPWKSTQINDVITIDKLKAYFKTQVEE